MLQLPAPFVVTPPEQAIVSRVHVAAELGHTDVSSWGSTHKERDDAGFLRYLSGTVGAPPTGIAAAADLTEVRLTVAQRTEAQNTAAAFLEAHGERDIWQNELRAWSGTVGTADAQRGAALFNQVMSLVGDEVSTMKHQYDRLRPYAIDHSLQTIPSPSTTNKRSSYPSGHAAAAFAAAEVLAALMPARAQSLRAEAEQVAYSRVYCAVHFPTDVAAAARIGAAIATYVLSQPVAPT